MKKQGRTLLEHRPGDVGVGADGACSYVQTGVADRGGVNPEKHMKRPKSMLYNINIHKSDSSCIENVAKYFFVEKFFYIFEVK